MYVILYPLLFTLFTSSRNKIPYFFHDKFRANFPQIRGRGWGSRMAKFGESFIKVWVKFH